MKPLALLLLATAALTFGGCASRETSTRHADLRRPAARNARYYDEVTGAYVSRNSYGPAFGNLGPRRNTAYSYSGSSRAQARRPYYY